MPQFADLIRLRCAGRRIRLEEYIDAHTRQQRRLADEIDDDLKHIDVRRLARSALPESAWPQRLGERANLAVEILAGEGVRAHDRSLAHAQLADVALLDLCP